MKELHNATFFISILQYFILSIILYEKSPCKCGNNSNLQGLSVSVNCLVVN